MIHAWAQKPEGPRQAERGGSHGQARERGGRRPGHRDFPALMAAELSLKLPF